MKTHFLFIIFLSGILMLSSCLSPTATKPLGYDQYKIYPQVGFINKIPTISHQNNIHVFFSGETPKDKAYIKIATVEQSATEATPYGDVIKILQSKGRSIGADAIFILGKEHTKQAVTDTEGQILYHISQKHVSAVAIKYIKNIKNVEQYPKKEIYHTYDLSTKGYKPYVTQNLNLDGSVSSRTQGNFYQSFVYKSSLNYLLKEQNQNWRYSKYQDLITRRIQYNPRTRRYISYKIMYDSLRRVKQVFNKTLTEDIEFLYNELSQIVEKKIYGQTYALTIDRNGREKYKPTKRGIIRKEILKYDDLGRLIEKEVFKIIKGKKMPWLKVTYSDFYTQADLMALSNDNYVE